MAKKKAKRRTRKSASPAEVVQNAIESAIDAVETADDRLSKAVTKALKGLGPSEDVLIELVEIANTLESVNQRLDSKVLAEAEDRVTWCHDEIAPSEGSGLEDGEPTEAEAAAEAVTDAIAQHLDWLRSRINTAIEHIEPEVADMAEQIDTLLTENERLREELAEYEDEEDDE
jgi:hypothetical protein